MADDIKLKPGDTFLARCVYKDTGGTPVNLTTAGIEISSKIKTQDGKQTFDLSYIPDPDQVTNTGQYILRGETGDWPIGKHLWDIRFEVPDLPNEPISSSSPTFPIYFGVAVS